MKWPEQKSNKFYGKSTENSDGYWEMMIITLSSCIISKWFQKPWERLQAKFNVPGKHQGQKNSDASADLISCTEITSLKLKIVGKKKKKKSFTNEDINCEIQFI